MIFSHLSRPYLLAIRQNGIPSTWNGAYYYSCEIVKNIIPHVETDRNWVTINAMGMCKDHSIVFIHNNTRPQLYDWLKDYKDLVLVCGIPETIPKVSHLGKAIWLPLSVDVEEVAQYKTRKTKNVAFAGRRAKRTFYNFPEGVDYIESLPRKLFLEEMAKYRGIYCVGRTALEAQILGCRVFPYDTRFPDPSRWEVMDNRDAAVILQQKLEEIDG